MSDFFGLIIGAVAFLIIGLFHPLVVKGEYYFGVKCWWVFLLIGIISLVFSFLVNNILWSSILGVLGFSSLWSIKEVFEQEERVKKGWFPQNPQRSKTKTKNSD